MSPHAKISTGNPVLSPLFEGKGTQIFFQITNPFQTENYDLFSISNSLNKCSLIIDPTVKGSIALGGDFKINERVTNIGIDKMLMCNYRDSRQNKHKICAYLCKIEIP